MGRTISVLAAVAVMVAMLVAFAAPAIADDHRNNHHRWNNWHDGDRVDRCDRFDRCDKFDRVDKFDHDDLLFISDFDDCEWNFTPGWFFGFWGWQWGWWFLDC